MHTKLQSAITRAFKELRRDGYFARQNYQCCSNCAGASIAEMLRQKPEKERRELCGAVFYHRQDGEVFSSTSETGFVRRHAWSADSGYVTEDRYLAIRYGQVTVDGETYGNPGVDIARRILDAFRKNGIRASWSGDVRDVIMVTGLADPTCASVNTPLTEPLLT